MKNLFLSLAFMLIGSFAFANTNKKVVSEKLDTKDVQLIEYSYFLNENGVNTCYARFCWNVSETQRECTPWQEVPCEIEIEVDVKAVKSVSAN